MATKEELFSSWKLPEINENTVKTGLKVKNSLYPIGLVDFIPINGNKVNWYCCGPTVYTDSHLGHARCYLSNDILRRLMKDYFSYDLSFVMNITDVDDKILKGAKEAGATDLFTYVRKWEKSFFDDLEALNIQLPDQITRVTEYIPEMIAYVETLIENGYAYEVEGSVYFDIEKYKVDGHVYPKLEPLAANGDVLNEDVNNAAAKRSPRDFALWKKTTDDIQSWKSPWGQGRVGWHLECSAMIYHAFGKQTTIDMHSGGVDLKFPHHDNEIAQAEGFHKCSQWVNYFVHNGALYIKGSKMSRSEKNYTVIKDILGLYSSKVIRLLVLDHKYDSLFNYNPDTAWNEPQIQDKQLTEFFALARSFTRKGANLENSQKFGEIEDELANFLREKKASVHTHFCTNFNTPDALHDIFALVNKLNIYMKQDPKTIKSTIIKVYYDYIGYILNVLGLDYTGKTGGNQENSIAPIVDDFVDFRTKIKEAAASKDFSSILQLCDGLRDAVLPNHGIQIEDQGKKGSIWKFKGKEELLAEIANKKKEAIAKAEAKKQAKIEKERLILRESSVIFKDDKYKKFKIGQVDDEGIPTHNEKGDEYVKKIRGKFEKDFKKHQKAKQNLLDKKAKEAKLNEEITEN